MPSVVVMDRPGRGGGKGTGETAPFLRTSFGREGKVK